MDASNLDAAIRAVCPIIGVRVGVASDRATWSYTADPSATAPQLAAADNVIATIDPVVKNIITFDDFIGRWTNAEYRLLLQSRATAVQGGSFAIPKSWDIAFARGQINLNNQLMQSLKSDIVSAGILTQARADVIFA
jgi:hypothetical protein